jgi:BolA protein
MTERISLIRQRLEASLKPLSLEVQDDGAKHVGHTGHGGGGHYTVRVVSACFEGLSLMQRHRMVYTAVADLMGSQIHALSIEARSDTEPQ